MRPVNAHNFFLSLCKFKNQKTMKRTPSQERKIMNEYIAELEKKLSDAYDKHMNASTPTARSAAKRKIAMTIQEIAFAKDAIKLIK